MFVVMVVEDDPHARKLICAVLERGGYSALPACDGQEALDLLDCKHVDLMIVDLMMPRMGGYELVKTLRDAGYDLPILIATAREALEDKCHGLRLGADDYMVKPIDHEELVLRINALLKRADIRRTKKLTIGSCTLDYESLSVFNSDGYTVQLSKKEFLILYKLLSYPERIFTKNQLMDEFWGYESDTYSDTVKVHINRIRNKISSFPEIDVITVRGLGYRGVKNG